MATGTSPNGEDRETPPAGSRNQDKGWEEHGDATVTIERPEEADAKSVGAGRTPSHKPRPILPSDKIEDDLEGRGKAKMGYLDRRGPGQEGLLEKPEVEAQAIEGGKGWQECHPQNPYRACPPRAGISEEDCPWAARHRTRAGSARQPQEPTPVMDLDVEQIERRNSRMGQRGHANPWAGVLSPK